MKNILKIAMAAVACLSITSCNDYFHEINWPHGGLTEDVLDQDNIRQKSMIPNMQLHIASQASAGEFQHAESLVGDVWGRMLMCAPGGADSGNSNFSGGDLSYYSPSHDGWLSNPFTYPMEFYTSYVETWKFTNHDSGNSIWALARIMRVATMHRVADTYGPIPYSAIDPENLILYMPYDKEEDLWPMMLDDLSTAIDDLQNCINLGTDIDIYNFDRIYNGDMNKWVKYANSLLLRLAVRVSNIRPDLTRQYAQKALNGGVIESNADNAMTCMRPGGLMGDRTSQLYSIVYSYNDSFAAADLTCYMNGYADPRLKSYFTTYETTDRNGDTEEVYVGLRAGSGAKVSDVRSICSRPKVDRYDDYPILTAAEVAFLRAECVYKGWTSDTKSARDFYEEGIRLSFEQWGASDYARYVADSQSVPAAYEDLITGNANCDAPSTITVAWAEDGKQLQRIITQKYIAMYPLGHETWCDYRRTGYPEFQPVYSKASSAYSGLKVANRLKFSVDESQKNSDNLAVAKTYLNGGDDYTTKLWWAK